MALPAYAFVFDTPQQVMHFQSLSLRQAANIQADNYNRKTQQVWKWPQFMPSKLIAHRPAVLLLDDTKALWNSC